eukprot:Gb_18826 [translate_table: standard]
MTLLFGRFRRYLHLPLLQDAFRFSPLCLHGAHGPIFGLRTTGKVYRERLDSVTSCCLFMVAGVRVLAQHVCCLRINDPQWCDLKLIFLMVVDGTDMMAKTIYNLKSAQIRLLDSLCTSEAILPKSPLIKHPATPWLSHENARKIFSKVYKFKEGEYVRNVEAMVKEDLWSMLEKKLTGAEISAKEKQFKEEGYRFLSQLKHNMSMKTDKSGVKYIEKVSTVAVKNSFVSKYLNPSNTSAYQSSEKVDMKVSIEQEQKLGIQWKVCELAPMKKDMDGSNFNSVHPIIPTCPQPVEVVAINPECEKRLKVVLQVRGVIDIHLSNLLSCKVAAKKLNHRIVFNRRKRKYSCFFHHTIPYWSVEGDGMQVSI